MSEASEDCIKAISDAGGVGAEQAQAIYEKVREAAAKHPEQFGLNYQKAAEELSAADRAAAQMDRLDALRNATIRTGIMKSIEDNGGLETAHTTLRSLLHGTNVGSRDSVEAMWRGNAAGWQALLSSRLHAAGLEKAAISGEMDRDIAREMWAINAGEKQATSNNPAASIAREMTTLLNNVRDRLNAVGARIGDAKDYVTHTSHDPDKMRSAAGSMRDDPDKAFQAWWKDTKPGLSDKTFENVEPKAGETMEQAQDRFGASVYAALVSGIHMTPDAAFGIKPGDYVPPSFEGTRNVARKVSQPRVLMFKDADAWHGYMQKYGIPSTLSEGIMQTLDKSARQLALMEKLGTNPAANLNQILRGIEERYRSDLDGVKKFQTRANGIKDVMAHLDGSANIPVNRMAAQISQSLRTWESMSSLGGVGITHFASVWPTVTSEMRQHGIGRFEALGNMVTRLLKGRGSVEHQEIAADLGAYAHGMTRDMFARWNPDDPIPGHLSSMANVFMKYTGIHYIFDNTQSAIREMLAANLARNGGKEFAQLEPHLSQMLGKYGIGEKEWNLLRAVKDLPADAGHSYLTPKDALRVDPVAAEAHLRSSGDIAEGAKPDAIGKAVGRLRQSLADKLYAYYGDAAAHGVVTAGVRERAMVLGQAKPGTVQGEMMRFLMQFKMWPLAAMNQIIGREIHLSLTRGEAAWNLGIMAAFSAMAGYSRMAINDVATGKPVRDPMDPHTMLAALAQGGGVGIMGDFLFGEVNRFGGGVVGTLGGPVIGDADQLIKLYGQWRQAKAGWPDLAHFAVRHVPFANLVYLKGALDYMLWYHLYEAASPGWWERTNRRLIREQGRPMTGYTPGGSIPWTPFDLSTTMGAQ